MKRHRFRRFRADRRTELQLPVMCADQMQQMQPHVFRFRREVFPDFRIFGRDFSPDRVDQLEPDRNVPIILRVVEL